ncbi:MAG: T9SS type A sorting domain-containing protein, partial [Bacteroidia bacterium]|nr:T9SS type A sorting domain-containing protein [Bacteroidia bacterium]
ASGVTPVTWTSGFTRDIRFYTNTDAACGEQQFGRERSVICGSGFLSNKDVTFQGLQYYPNPVDSILNLTSKENIDQVLIYNMIGQEVLKVSPNS